MWRHMDKLQKEDGCQTAELSQKGKQNEEWTQVFEMNTPERWSTTSSDSDLSSLFLTGEVKTKPWKSRDGTFTNV